MGAILLGFPQRGARIGIHVQREWPMPMDSLTPRNTVDEELREIFRSLADLGGAGGRPKYRVAVCHQLAYKLVEGRAHAKLVYPLCHLVRAAGLAAGGRRDLGASLAFFCADEAGERYGAASWFQNRLAGTVADEAACDAGGVLLRYEDAGGPYRVPYSAIPLLSAFFDFLLLSEDYHRLEPQLAPLFRPGLRLGELQDISKALSRAVYAYLKDHTNPVQEGRNLDAVAAFMLDRMAERRSERDFSDEDLDDSAVLEFWRLRSLEPDSGFVTYRNVYKTFLRLVLRMRDHSQRASMAAARPVGADYDGREQEIADRASPELEAMRSGQSVADVAFEEEWDPVAALAELSAQGPKFFMGSELEILEALQRHIAVCPRLTRSYLRDQVFGDRQAELVAERKKAGSVSVQSIAAGPREDYGSHIDRIDKLAEHVETLLEAAGYMLVRQRDEATVQLEIARRGEAALKKLKRKGFDKLQARDPAALATTREAVDPIVSVQGWLARMLPAFGARDSWEARQAEDFAIFVDQFDRLYGASR